MGVDFESVPQVVVDYRMKRPKQRTLFYRWWSALGSENGFLAGSYPDGITTVEGVPVEATVRVLLRSTDPAFDGLVVAETQSRPDGTWLVEGLNPNLRYDVVGRRPGFNDVIMTDITPSNPPRISDSRITAYVGLPLEHTLKTFGGVEPRVVTLKSGSFPEGVTFEAGTLSGAWPTGSVGEYPAVFTVTDSTGDSTDKTVVVELILLPLQIKSDYSVPESYLSDRAINPVTFAASGGEAPYTFSVTGVLPAGLAFDVNTGELTGTPTTGGTYSFSINVTDARGTAIGLPFDVEVVQPLEVLDTNLALNKSIDSNNTISYKNSSSSPVNGNINSSNYTSFGSGEAWLSVDLGAIYNINTIKVWFYWLDNRTYYDKRIQYSVDGATWVSVYDDTVDPVYNETSAGKEFVFDKDAARFVRVVTNGSTASGGNHVIEIEAYLNVSPMTD